MLKLLVTLLIVPFVSVSAGYDFGQFGWSTESIEIAQKVERASTPEEQEQLKTLLGDRADWHPQAAALLEDVYERANERKLAVKGRRLWWDTCDASTETECNGLVGEQCTACTWGSSSCAPTDCGDYKSDGACCNNTANVATGCFWDNSSSFSSFHSCEANTCKTRASVGTGVTEQKAICDAQPGCVSFCHAANQKFECKEGVAADWDCTCTSSSSTECVKKDKVTGTATTQNLDQALGLSSSCSITDCSICLKNKDCAAKKTAAKTGGTCEQRCNGLAQCDAEVQCLYCGPTSASTCTAAHAVSPSCIDISLSATTTTTSATCKAICDSEKVRCPSTCGTTSTCEDSALLAAADRSGVGMAAVLVIVAGTLY